MLKYLIRRRRGAYVGGFSPRFPVTWTRSVHSARWFRTKGGAIAHIVAAELPRDECDVVTRASVHTDAMIELVSKRGDVRSLMISGRQPTDGGLAKVGAMADLEQLEDFYATAITDIGLMHLRSLTSLRKLYIKGTQVTEQGIEGLREALTRCKIIWAPTARSVKTPDETKPEEPVEQWKQRQRIKEKAEEARAAKRRELAWKREVAAQKQSAVANRKAIRHRGD